MLKNILGVLTGPFKRNQLNQVIFFITGNCNLRCQHCFYWKNLNHNNDLTFEEIQKISQNLPRFNLLLLSGGEPFLREEIVEIVKLFRKNNHILQVSIPTNAFLVSKTVSQLKELLKIDPSLTVSVNFSVDGLKEIHDQTRGRTDSFKHVITAIKKTNLLKTKFPNLVVNMNTAITTKNFDYIPNLINFIKTQGHNFIDGHYFEIIRGEPPKAGMKEFTKTNITKLYEKIILPYQEDIVRQRNGGKWTNNFFTSLAKANFSFIYKTQLANFFDRKRWPMACVAGQNSIVIDHSGNFSSCELRKPIINLKESKFNISKLLKSHKMTKELENIKKEKCDCTHVCFLTESMYKSPLTVFILLPIHWLKIILLDFFNVQ